MRRLIILLVLLLTAVACGQSTPDPTPTATAVVPPTPTADPTPTPSPLVQGTDDFPWWNDTVFYEIFVRSFYDTDGDGIGDINGVIEKLDYLNDGDPSTTDDLGVTGIWLMPVMESPSYHGYDVVDYYQIDTEYGSNEDFKRLIEEAHKRGIRVIVDLVMNHTSTQHPWFEQSRDPDSEYRDWYVWQEANPGYGGPWGQQVWHSTADGYYYGVFWDGMPDLNFENPDVTDAILDAAEFWLDEMDADGFRLDAIKHLVEDGRIQENSSQTHDWLQEFYTFYKGVEPDAFAVGEAWSSTREVLQYTGDEVDIAFQFDLAEDILASSNNGRSSQIARTMSSIVDDFPPGQYATFITNHDQNRVMSHLGRNEDKARVAASILLTSPGVPFIYYGEEIGMTGIKPDENLRRPMQWDHETFRTGFTTGTPWRSPANDYEERSVALQIDDPDSLLNHYRQLIHLRNAHDALRIGDWLAVESEQAQIYAFLRTTDSQQLLVLINLSGDEISDYSLALADGPLTAAGSAELLLGQPTAVATPSISANGGFSDYVPVPTLPAHSTFIIDLTP